MASTEYEGLPVRKHSVAVRGASGDALNGSLKVSPRDFHPGERAFMVLEVVPADVNHKPMDEGEAWNRVQVVKAARGCFVDGDVALPYLDEVARKLEDLRIEETGQERLDLGDDAKREKTISEHERNMHKRKRKGCPMCYPVTDEDVARLEEFELHQRESANGQGDEANPLPAARKRRSRAAKK